MLNSTHELKRQLPGRIAPAGRSALARRPPFQLCSNKIRTLGGLLPAAR